MDTKLTSRRSFLQSNLSSAAALAGGVGALRSAQGQKNGSAVPWYRRAYRWGQTNITEKDPVRYDIPWWREHWKRTEVQAVIVNRGDCRLLSEQVSAPSSRRVPERTRPVRRTDEGGS